jgi:hypothetical protein
VANATTGAVPIMPANVADLPGFIGELQVNRARPASE